MPASQNLPPPRCMNCGYDVCGITSDLCPECGQEYYLPVAMFHDVGRFNAAAAMLADEGIDRRIVQVNAPSNARSAWAGGVRDEFGAATLFVKRSDIGRARELMDELASVTRSIVDRSEPICPKCNAQMDPKGPEKCPACGAEFQWVDDEVLQIEPKATEATSDARCLRSASTGTQRASLGIWVILTTLLSIPAMAMIAFSGVTQDLYSQVLLGVGCGAALTALFLIRRSTN